MNSPTEKTVEGPHQVDPVDQPPVLHRKIAKLPKPLRDLINTMLGDGGSAREVIAKLQASTDPPLPYPISEMNISDWKDTGYRRHLAEQERLTLVQANREAAGELVSSQDITTLPEATLQILANQYYEFLCNFSAETLKEKLSEDPLKYTRFINVFARLVREIVYLRKFRNASAKAAASELKNLDPDRDLSDNEYALLVNKMDQVFKVARPKFADHPANNQKSQTKEALHENGQGSTSDAASAPSPRKPTP
jgi:hypothetical protein